MKIQKIILMGLIAGMCGELGARSIKDLFEDGEDIRVSRGRLVLSDYTLTDLDGLLDVPGIETLRSLLLSDNQLRELPKNIDQITSLQYLNLSNNQISTLPESICNLTNLTVLNLASNRLRTLPANIGDLINLEKLNLYNNQLSDLPASVGNLLSLEELNLFDNRNLPPTTIRSIRQAFARRGTRPQILTNVEEEVGSEEIEEAMKELATKDALVKENIAQTTPRHTTQVAQQSHLKKKQRTKFAKHDKKTKSAVA